ncbi:MAG: hypothetical protein ILP19_00475 [Oscillospiraceae bacterium]|nr:hypothetical protein [Oscillospiraceae bacterium]
MTHRIPHDFRYKDIYIKGRPQHRKYDDFCIKHPMMDTGRRAKIFAPFDALAGFYELVLSKEIHYVEKAVPDEQRTHCLDRRTAMLGELVRNTADARDRHITVSVTYFTPCTDILNDAYGERGRYITVSGTVQKVDTVFRQLVIGDLPIDFDDIYTIEGQIFGAEEAG